jgi:hypothetical protein
MKIMIIFNAIALLVFGLLWIVRPNLTDLGVRGRYVELDRAGVINEGALHQFHPDREFFPNSRNGVPRYIAGPALEAERENAFAAMLAVGLNLFAASLISIRKARSQKTANMRPNTENIP